jgi:hypothetical protein
MSNTTGSIAVTNRSDLLYEIRAAVDAALRAEKAGKSYGPFAVTNGSVEVTIAASAKKTSGPLVG